MDTTLIKLKAELSSSEFFGRKYSELLDSESTNGQLAAEVSQLLESILSDIGDRISDFQVSSLTKLFKAFDEIKRKIDPKRLKDFCHYYNSEEEELFLYRKTEEGLTNLIFYAKETIVYSFIGIHSGRELFFFEENKLDFEKLAYKFFSH
jgi:hypothetical protein